MFNNVSDLLDQHFSSGQVNLSRFVLKYINPLKKEHLHARLTGIRARVMSSSSCSSCLEKYPVDDEANVLRTIASLM